MGSLIKKIGSVLTQLIRPHKKSAIVFYAKDIDYMRVKNSDYIILQPNYTDTQNIGFLENRDKIYGYVSLCEISKTVPEYKSVKEDWIVAKNSDWDSEVLDIRDSEYREFLFDEIIDPIIQSGFKNIFFDTVDSYQLASKTDKERVVYEEYIALFINKVYKKYPKIKIIINRGFEVIDDIYESVEAVLFESYYFGLGSGDEVYKKISDQDRNWLHIHLDRIKDYGLDIIAVDYLDEKDMNKADEAIAIIRENGMIPYVSNRSLNIYGRGNEVEI